MQGPHEFLTCPTNHNPSSPTQRTSSPFPTHTSTTTGKHPSSGTATPTAPKTPGTCASPTATITGATSTRARRLCDSEPGTSSTATSMKLQTALTRATTRRSWSNLMSLLVARSPCIARTTGMLLRATMTLEQVVMRRWWGR